MVTYIFNIVKIDVNFNNIIKYTWNDSWYWINNGKSIYIILFLLLTIEMLIFNLKT